MIKGYRDFYYNVKDMARAVRFYEALGLKKTYGHQWWSTMTVGGLVLGLHWNQDQDVPSTPRDSHGQEAGGTLTLHSDDIAQDRKVIESAGGRVLGEAKQDWGHMLTFEDLDGNVLKLMKPNL